MTEKTYNVLFICTGNSARSIMAEALMTSMGRGRFRGFSAGSRPAGSIHPLAIEQLKAAHCTVDGLRSKSWDEFAAPGAPHMDFIITVCDSAAGEACPTWPGHPVTAHWGFMDPAAAGGTDEHQHDVFHDVFRQIMSRINIFMSLPDHLLERNAIRDQLNNLGEVVA
jgi:arsenate reductase